MLSRASSRVFGAALSAQASIRASTVLSSVSRRCLAAPSYIQSKAYSTDRGLSNYKLASKNLVEAAAQELRQESDTIAQAGEALAVADLEEHTNFSVEASPSKITLTRLIGATQFKVSVNPPELRDLASELGMGEEDMEEGDKEDELMTGFAIPVELEITNTNTPNKRTLMSLTFYQTEGVDFTGNSLAHLVDDKIVYACEDTTTLDETMAQHLIDALSSAGINDKFAKSVIEVVLEQESIGYGQFLTSVVETFE